MSIQLGRAPFALRRCGGDDDWWCPGLTATRLHQAASSGHPAFWWHSWLPGQTWSGPGPHDSHSSPTHILPAAKSPPPVARLFLLFFLWVPDPWQLLLDYIVWTQLNCTKCFASSIHVPETSTLLYWNYMGHCHLVIKIKIHVTVTMHSVKCWSNQPTSLRENLQNPGKVNISLGLLQPRISTLYILEMQLHRAGSLHMHC